MAGVAGVIVRPAGNGRQAAVPAFIRGSLGGGPARYASAPESGSPRAQSPGVAKALNSSPWGGGTEYQLAEIVKVIEQVS